MSLNAYNALVQSLKDTLFWALLMVLLLLGVVSTVQRNDANQSAASYALARVAPSAQESKAVGLFYASAKVAPMRLSFDEKDILINEAWIEAITVPEFRFVWFKKEVVVGYRLCLSVKEGQELFQTPQSAPNFAEVRSGSNFTTLSGGSLFHLSIPKPKEAVPSFDIFLVRIESPSHHLSATRSDPAQIPSPTPLPPNK